MADRFPLILNTSANQIQEIASGDTLDLTGTNIKGVGIITATNLSGNIIAGAGTSNIVSGILTAVAADIDDFVDVGSNIQLGNAGVITATTFKGDGDFVELDVDGHTNLDNLSVAGVSTFAGNSDFSAGIDVTGHATVSQSLTVSGGYVYAAGGVQIENSDPRINLIDTNGNPDYHIRNSGGSLVIRNTTNGVNNLVINSGGEAVFGGNGVFSGNLSVGGVLTYEDVTNVDSVGLITARNGINVSSGTATFQGAIDANGDLDVDGHTNLDNVSVAGVSTFTGNADFSAGIDVTGVIETTVAGADNMLKIKTTSSGDPILQLNAAGSGGHDIYYNRSTNELTFKSAGGSDRLKIAANGDLLPAVDSQYNIGSSSVRFANIYADTLYGAGSNITALNGSNIASGTVPVARIGTGTKNSTTFYRGDGTFQTVSTDLVGDTSPQLGGDLDTNSHHILIDDDHEVKWGGNSDIRIFHANGNANFIQSYNDVDLRIHTFGTSAKLRLQTNESQNSVVCTPNGSTELYHTGNKKFETLSTGCTIFGNGTQGKLTIGDTGDVDLILAADSDNADESHNPTIHFLQDGGNTYLKIGVEGGNGQTLTNSTGNCPYICTTQSIALQLGSNSNIRWEISGSGSFRPIADNTYDIGTSGQRVRNIYVNDLQLSNKAKKDEGGNDVDGTWGDFTIQEGESDLYLINNRNGKKYKFNLTEVS